MLKRRDVIKTLGIGGLALSLPLPALAQGQLKVADLGGGFSLIRGAGTNVLVAQGPESLVVVDGGLREHAEALHREIQSLGGGKPVQALFNANWRPEHRGLNHRLDGESAIIAHENTRLWQTVDVYVEWEDKHYQPLPDQAQANETFYEDGSLSLGDREVRYVHLPRAHTDGDLYVHFPEANLLAVSDLLSVGRYPVLDYVTGGWVRGLQEATDALLDVADDETRVLAADGGVYGRQELQDQADMLAVAYDKVADAFRAGMSLEDFKQTEPARDFPGQWGDPDLFLTQLYRGTWYHIPGRAVRNII